MSDQTPADGTPVEPVKKQSRSRTQTFTVESIAKARLKKRGVSTSDARVADEKKVVRGMLRRSFDDLTKAAPASYGPRGKVKTHHNDRRPWGAIPASVAKTLIK
jgi:hypothetical protein